MKLRSSVAGLDKDELIKIIEEGKDAARELHSRLRDESTASGNLDVLGKCFRYSRGDRHAETYYHVVETNGVLLIVNKFEIDTKDRIFISLKAKDSASHQFLQHLCKEISREEYEKVRDDMLLQIAGFLEIKDER